MNTPKSDHRKSRENSQERSYFQFSGPVEAFIEEVVFFSQEGIRLVELKQEFLT